ncbi:hypothetical protein PInf_009323 [Phytophthora infestans]|nr:hypothetical protein PInf_009323 [Phytophthora infestans]
MMDSEHVPCILVWAIREYSVMADSQNTFVTEQWPGVSDGPVVVTQCGSSKPVEPLWDGTKLKKGEAKSANLDGRITVGGSLADGAKVDEYGQSAEV